MDDETNFRRVDTGIRLDVVLVVDHDVSLACGLCEGREGGIVTLLPVFGDACSVCHRGYDEKEEGFNVHVCVLGQRLSTGLTTRSNS